MPHDALGHARGAAGIDDVKIIRVAWREVAHIRTLRQRFFVIVESGIDGRAGIVRHTEHVPQFPGEVYYLRHVRCEGLVGDDGHEIRIVVQVLQLPCHIVVVDVDGYRAQFVRRQHAFQVFAAVVQLQSDVVAAANAEGAPAVGQASRALVQFPEAQLALLRNDCGTLRHGIGNGFEQVGEIEGQFRCHCPAVLLLGNA